MTLAGKRIVITRQPDQAQKLITALKDRGAIPVSLPLIQIQPPADPGPLDQAISRIAAYDWVIFTSANTVNQVSQRLSELPAKCPAIAAIGPATARALEDYGLPVTLVAEKYVAESLFNTLSNYTDLRGKRILLPQSNIARPMLALKLQEAGALVDVVIAYETVRPDVMPGYSSESFDAITFTSSSTIQNFVALFDSPLAVIGDAMVAVIGPVTAHAARDLGLPVHIMADPHTIDGLITALSDAFERNIVS